MSKRKDVLLKLRKYIEDKKNVRYNYVEETDKGTCYCAVGFLMNECGFDFSERDFLKDCNGDTVSTILGLFDLKELQELFDARELRRLQRMNDSCHREDLIDYIDELLEVELND